MWQVWDELLWVGPYIHVHETDKMVKDLFSIWVDQFSGQHEQSIQPLHLVYMTVSQVVCVNQMKHNTTKDKPWLYEEDLFFMLI